jgi:hypothetical protein
MRRKNAPGLCGCVIWLRRTNVGLGLAPGMAVVLSGCVIWLISTTTARRYIALAKTRPNSAFFREKHYIFSAKSQKNNEFFEMYPICNPALLY